MPTTDAKKYRAKNPVRKASSDKGLSGIENLDPRTTVLKETASVIPFALKTLIVVAVGGGIIYYLSGKWKNRFISKPEISSYPQSNISKAEAESRANKIYGAVGIFSGDFDQIVDAFSHPSGLNYNALIRIYNAFGNRKSTYLSSEMNLTEWLSDQLDDYQIQQISLITSGVII